MTTTKVATIGISDQRCKCGQKREQKGPEDVGVNNNDRRER